MKDDDEKKPFVQDAIKKIVNKVINVDKEDTDSVKPGIINNVMKSVEDDIQKTAETENILEDVKKELVEGIKKIVDQKEDDVLSSTTPKPSGETYRITMRSEDKMSTEEIAGLAGAICIILLVLALFYFCQDFKCSQFLTFIRTKLVLMWNFIRRTTICLWNCMRCCLYFCIAGTESKY